MNATPRRGAQGGGRGGPGPLGSRKDRGRPSVLSVRLASETKRRIREAASREGVAPSEWVRRRLGEALRREALGGEAAGREARGPARTSSPRGGPS